MTWYAFAVPVVATALLVRLEAKLIGPYWAWLEMISDLGYDDTQTSRTRRLALIRRVAIPGLAGFLLMLGLSGTYEHTDLAIVGASTAGLLLWPLVFGSLPAGGSSRYLIAVYALLVVAFAGSCWLGGYVVSFARADEGLWHFLQENILSMTLGVVATAFGTGGLVRASGVVSRQRNEVGE